MRIREGDKLKIVFHIKYGYFKYQFMLFGLSNTPASFQGYINEMLAEKLDVFVIVYLDNIMIYIAKLGQQLVEAVCGVFAQLQKHRLFANLKKCQFYQDKVQFLEYIVSAQRI